MSPARTDTIVDCSGVGFGGITRVLTELVRYWPADQRLRIVAAPRSWEPPADRSAEVVIVSRQTSHRAHTIASASLALRRASASRSETARVLSLSPSLATAGSRLPVTTVVHDVAFRLWPNELPRAVRRYRQASYAVAIRRAALLLCVSARTQHDLLGLYGVSGERCQVWQPGSDLSTVPGRLPDVLDAVRQRGGRYVVVAGHAPHKGAELAISAIAKLPDLVLAVLTGGQPADGFRSAAARSGASDRVIFLDRLPDADYAATVAAATAFLMPSHFEGYGLPAVEALRLGTPTIISPDPALQEATGANAVRMDGWTDDALCRAIARIDRTADGESSRSTGRSWRAATADLAGRLTGRPEHHPVSTCG
jgi:glycosyltransferase involved in cell wall biosynthesis